MPDPLRMGRKRLRCSLAKKRTEPNKPTCSNRGGLFLCETRDGQ